jgi:hypothetical protein
MSTPDFRGDYHATRRLDIGYRSLWLGGSCAFPSISFNRCWVEEEIAIFTTHSEGSERLVDDGGDLF